MKNPFISLDVSASPFDEKIKLHEAWEHFMIGNQQNLSIRPLMLESWQRCQTKGVHPLQAKAPISLANSAVEEFISDNPLHPLLEPFLMKLTDVASGSGHMVVFSNENGNIVFLQGEESVRRKAEEMNFMIGASWAEQHIGTNAIGTALETRTPIQVFAGEHYCQDVHGWACSAAPIRDPATNKVLGVIDLTGFWSAIHPHSLSAVISTAHAIEEKLLHRLQYEHFRLFEYYVELTTRKPGLDLVVLDRGLSVVKASPVLYENGWIDSKNKLAGCPQTLSNPYTHNWELHKGHSKWAFELVPYLYKNHPIGAIVHVHRPPIHVHSQASHTLKHSFASMIGNSPLFRAVISEARTAAKTHLPVLIEGESGTGKELLAQAIHAASDRASKPFIAVNCGAIPKELAVSEFFGYEEGAFTGGVKGGRLGKFQQADGGTIFLDEIGDMPLELQTILLRVLEEGEIIRVGGRKPIKLNVRVISATNQDLKKSIENGTFRRDLYYRINILSLKIPALRERACDIPLLIDYHLKKACAEVGRSPLKIDPAAMEILKSYAWPGNVRELRNFVYRMLTKATDDAITVELLPSELKKEQTKLEMDERIILQQGTIGTLPLQDNPSLKDHELQMILKVLHELNGNVSETAKRLGIHRSTIYRKLGKNPLGK